MYVLLDCCWYLFHSQPLKNRLALSSVPLSLPCRLLVCSQAAELLGVEGTADADSQGLSKKCKESIFCLLVILACCSWNLMHLNSLTAESMLNMLALENFWVT